MLGVINFGAFLVAAILLNLTPGVDTLYVLGKSVTGGVRVGIVSGLGISCGLFVHTLLVALGLSVVLVSSPWLFGAIKVAGACYLAFLGIRTILSKTSLVAAAGEGAVETEIRGSANQATPVPLASQSSQTPLSPQSQASRVSRNGLRRAYLQGVITNVANPKVALFFLAFLPQFVDPAAALNPLPFLVLGGCFIVTSTIWSSILALGAGQIKRLLDKRPRIARVAQYATGVLYIILGLSIFAAPTPE